MSAQPPSPSPRPEDVPSGRLTSPSVQRRAHYRAGDDQPVLVGLADPDGGVPLSFVARLTDLSESGLRLRAEAGHALLLPLGREVDLVVSLPESNEELRGRVVHRDAPGAAGSVVVGLSFLDAGPGTADRIRRHVFAVQREMLARRRAPRG